MGLEINQIAIPHTDDDVRRLPYITQLSELNDGPFPQTTEDFTLEWSTVFQLPFRYLSKPMSVQWVEIAHVQDTTLVT